MPLESQQFAFAHADLAATSLSASTAPLQPLVVPQVEFFPADTPRVRAHDSPPDLFVLNSTFQV